MFFNNYCDEENREHFNNVENEEKIRDLSLVGDICSTTVSLIDNKDSFNKKNILWSFKPTSKPLDAFIIDNSKIYQHIYRPIEPSNIFPLINNNSLSIYIEQFDNHQYAVTSYHPSLSLNLFNNFNKLYDIHIPQLISSIENDNVKEKDNMALISMKENFWNTFVISKEGICNKIQMYSLNTDKINKTLYFNDSFDSPIINKERFANSSKLENLNQIFFSKLFKMNYLLIMTATIILFIGLVLLKVMKKNIKPKEKQKEKKIHNIESKNKNKNKHHQRLNDKLKEKNLYQVGNLEIYLNKILGKKYLY